MCSFLFFFLKEFMYDWMPTQTLSELVCRFIASLYQYQYQLFASQLQTHTFCLLCENGPGPFKYFSLLAVTMLNFISRRYWRGITQEILLLGSSVFAWQAPAVYTGFSIIRLLQCLHLLQYHSAVVHGIQKHSVAGSFLWHSP